MIYIRFGRKYRMYGFKLFRNKIRKFEEDADNLEIPLKENCLIFLSIHLKRII